MCTPGENTPSSPTTPSIIFLITSTVYVKLNFTSEKNTNKIRPTRSPLTFVQRTHYWCSRGEFVCLTAQNGVPECLKSRIQQVGWVAKSLKVTQTFSTWCNKSEFSDSVRPSKVYGRQVILKLQSCYLAVLYQFRKWLCSTTIKSHLWSFQQRFPRALCIALTVRI